VGKITKYQGNSKSTSDFFPGKSLKEKEGRLQLLWTSRICVSVAAGFKKGKKKRRGKGGVAKGSAEGRAGSSFRNSRKKEMREALEGWWGGRREKNKRRRRKKKHQPNTLPLRTFLTSCGKRRGNSDQLVQGGRERGNSSKLFPSRKEKLTS